MTSRLFSMLTGFLLIVGAVQSVGWRVQGTISPVVAAIGAGLFLLVWLMGYHAHDE